MSDQHGFFHFRLDLEEAGLFERLAVSVDFEDVTKGRVGNHLTRPGPQGVPIVRTTTRYQRPAFTFTQAHDDIIEKIKGASAGHLDLLEEPFNHALIEVYDQRYTKMGYHSDQSLDLEEGSHIAVFSFYDRALRGSGRGVRQLMVKSKESGERFSMPLEHGSVVVFSVETNARHAHKIVLPTPAKEETRWLGLTLRCSKTFVKFTDGETILEGGSRLTLADSDQRQEFYRLRGAENRSMAYRYPDLSYTLSEGDLMPPVCL